MALTFREVTDVREWDEHVLRNAPDALFQTWSWGEVGRAIGTPLFRIGAFDADKLVGTLQMVKINARRGTFLHVRHGPVFSQQSQSYWREVTAFLRKKAKEGGAYFVRVSPKIADTADNRAQLVGLGYRAAPIHAMDAERCWVVDLAGSEEELLGGMRKTTRYEIRQAIKLGVVVKASSDAKDLEAFLALYSKTASRHGFVPHEGIVEEFHQFMRNNQAMLLLGYHDRALISAALVLFCGKAAIYHHGASIPSRVPVSVLIQWEAIREAKKRGMEVYNFWGIAPEDKPNHPWRGITLFKKGFGGREISYIHAHDLPVSPFYWFAWGIETWRRILRGY